MGESAEAGIQDQKREGSQRTHAFWRGTGGGEAPLLRLPLGQSAGAHPSSAGSFFLASSATWSAKHLPELREAGEKTGRSVRLLRKRRAAEARLRSSPGLFSPAQERTDNRRCLLTGPRLGQSQVEHLGRGGFTDHINQGFYSKPKGNITLAYGLFKSHYTVMLDTVHTIVIKKIRKKVQSFVYLKCYIIIALSVVFVQVCHFCRFLCCRYYGGPRQIFMCKLFNLLIVEFPKTPRERMPTSQRKAIGNVRLCNVVIALTFPCDQVGKCYP